jgi:hypothetical protein
MTNIPRRQRAIRRPRSHYAMARPAFRKSDAIASLLLRLLLAVCLVAIDVYIDTAILFIRAANLLGSRMVVRDPRIPDNRSWIVVDFDAALLDLLAELARAQRLWAETASGRSAEGEVANMARSPSLPAHRSILVIDIEGFTRRTGPVSAELRDELYRILEKVLRVTAVDGRRRDLFSDRGDGILTLVSPSVTGHTASPGTKRENHGLSERRAVAVSMRLNPLGVAAARALTPGACPGVGAVRTRLRCRPAGKSRCPGREDVATAIRMLCGGNHPRRSHPGVLARISLLCDGTRGISLSVVRRRSGLTGKSRMTAARIGGRMEVQT